jgi:dephospho-CoA kinase
MARQLKLQISAIIGGMNMSGLGAKSACGNRQAKPVIGLVGGIGSGKSLVAAEFARHRGHVVAADQLGHEALEQPAIRAGIKERWGAAVFGEGGNVDRRRLGAWVFADPDERKALEALVFPFIERRITEEMGAAQRNPDVAFIVLDAAIMLETGWNRHCDRLVYVDAPRTVRAERLARQRGWTEEDLEAREKAQFPVAEKRDRADFVIDNSGPPEKIREQVNQLLTEWSLGR